MKNVNFSTKADFFAKNSENFGNIDVNWKTLIAMKINKFISANLSTSLIYDDDLRIAIMREDENARTGARVQFKEVFTLGIQYQFKR